jgi:hypothetical protein
MRQSWAITMPLTLDDIRHLDAAEGWLEGGEYANSFDELEPTTTIAGTVASLRFELYNADQEHVAAANLALGVQRRFPNEPAGFVWRAVSLSKLGCTQEAYDGLEKVAGKFDGLGMVPYVLAILAAQLHRMQLARDWLAKHLRRRMANN